MLRNPDRVNQFPIFSFTFCGIPRNGDWYYDDTTSLAGAPAAVGGSALTSLINTSGVGDTGVHVNYLGTNENVYDLHYTTAWSYFDPTEVAGAPSAASGSGLTSYQDNNGGIRLYFIGTNSHVYELYWPAQREASYTDLTAASGTGATAGSGSPLTCQIDPAST